MNLPEDDDDVQRLLALTHELMPDGEHLYTIDQEAVQVAGELAGLIDLGEIVTWFRNRFLPRFGYYPAFIKVTAVKHG